MQKGEPMEHVLIRAEIFGENAAGQKHIHLLANNADGIHFWTDDKSIVRSIEPERKKGKWIDYTEDGYVECPFCHSATNCDGNKDELHFCFSCGADMREDER